ncbi:hypothetical protein, partial [Enterobacter intestinihominis]
LGGPGFFKPFCIGRKVIFLISHWLWGLVCGKTWSFLFKMGFSNAISFQESKPRPQNTYKAAITRG